MFFFLVTIHSAVFPFPEKFRCNPWSVKSFLLRFVIGPIMASKLPSSRVGHIPVVLTCLEGEQFLVVYCISNHMKNISSVVVVVLPLNLNSITHI